jgi:hypothetical protein
MTSGTQRTPQPVALASNHRPIRKDSVAGAEGLSGDLDIESV